LLHSDAEFEHSFESDLESTSRDIGLKQLRLANFAIIIKELQNLKASKNTRLEGLEIGCGNGWWLETCRANDIECTGIEPEHIYEHYHKENGLNVVYGFYPEVSPKKKADMILSFLTTFLNISPISMRWWKACARTLPRMDC